MPLSPLFMYGSYMYLIMYRKYLLLLFSNPLKPGILCTCTNSVYQASPWGWGLGTSLVPSSQCTCHYVSSPGLPHPPGNACGSTNAEWGATEEPLWEHQWDQSVQQVSTCTTYLQSNLNYPNPIIQTLQLGPVHNINNSTQPSLSKCFCMLRASSDSQGWIIPSKDLRSASVVKLNKKA